MHQFNRALVLALALGVIAPAAVAAPQADPEPPPLWSQTIDGYPVHIYTEAAALNRPASDRAVLVLGTFSDAHTSIAEAKLLVNPSTGRPYDVIIGLSKVAAPTGDSFRKQWRGYVGELGGRVFADHFSGEKNAAALKKGIEQRFGSPLEAAHIDMHSNGVPVGISAIEQDAFKGVRQMHLMGPDIGYAGKHVAEDRLNRMKDRGVEQVHIHRTKGDIIHSLGHLTEGIAEAGRPFADAVVQRAVEAVTQAMVLPAAGGKPGSIIHSHEYVHANFTTPARDPFDSHYVKNYIAQRAEHSRDPELIKKTQALMGAPEYNHAIGRPLDLTMPSSRLYQGRPLSDILRGNTPAQNASLIEELSARLETADSTLRRDNLRFMIDYAQAYVAAKDDSQASAKGVRIAFDERVLAAVLQRGTTAQNGALLKELGDRLRQAQTEAQRKAVFEAFQAKLTARFQQAKPTRRLDELTAVSLKALVAKAEAARASGAALPQDVKYPGGLTRIHGYAIAGDDILILGRSDAGDVTPLSLDDLIVGIRAAWKDNETPLVSLDPDPDNMMGDPRVRIGGVPRDSAFALTMLEADYAMKKIMAGVEPVNVRGYETLKAILAAADRTFISRFWLYPIQPDMGDIQIAGDGSSALFMGGVQVLSEEMLLLKEGLVGTGQTFGPADQAARSFSSHYEAIASQKPVFRRLEGLFDIVLLARVWRNTGITSPLLDRLCALSHEPVSIAATYPAVRVVVRRDGPIEFFLHGGALAKVGGGRFSWLAMEADEFAAIRKQGRAITGDGAVAGRISGAGVVVALPSKRSDDSSLQFSSALAGLLRGELDSALAAANKLIEQSPTDGEALMLRAVIHLRRADYQHARRDVDRARELYPDSPEIDAASAEIEFQCAWMEGKPESALKALEWNLRGDPKSAQAYLARGQALAVLDRHDDARKAYEQALAIDPASAVACAQLAQLELAAGRLLAAKPWVQKAVALNPQLPAVRLAQAYWEQATIRPDLAEALAKGVWEDKAASPTVRLQALTVLAAVAASREKWKDVDRYITMMDEVTPGSPEVLVVAAEIAFTWGEPEIGRQYLQRAQRMSPDHPLVKKLRRTKGK